MTIKDVDRVEKYIRRELKKLQKAHVEVGIRDESLAADGSSILQYATLNEYGIGVPERSFIRSTADEEKKKWGGLMQEAIESVLDLTAPNANVALSRIGLVARDDIKDKISSGVEPENSRSTRKKKTGSPTGITTTLIDTGAMRAAVNYVVVGL